MCLCRRHKRSQYVRARTPKLLFSPNSRTFDRHVSGFFGIKSNLIIFISQQMACNHITLSGCVVWVLQVNRPPSHNPLCLAISLTFLPGNSIFVATFPANIFHAYSRCLRFSIGFMNKKCKVYTRCVWKRLTYLSTKLLLLRQKKDDGDYGNFQ